MDKTLQITFYKSETNGIKILEFSRGEIIGFFIPKLLFSNELLKSNYFENIITNSGVYFLLGEEIYIGQALNIFERLKGHIREGKKEFKDIICFTTSNNSFDEGDINYLEKSIISQAKQNSDMSLMNLNIGNNTNIRNFRKSDLDQYTDEIKFILNILGSNFLEKTREKKISNDDFFYIDSKETKGKLILDEKGYIVVSGSFGKDNQKPSMTKSYITLKNELIEKGIIQKFDGKLMFTKDYIFTSASAPAQILLGYSVSGPQKWKSKDGVTLGDYERSKFID
ncbi:GIY-YIG nuclease family protein [Candidatus Gracilibacteria bacterium]|nr:GIY-YIG nuclease family protein [Candidatus Gracilibacteria bacterium]